MRHSLYFTLMTSMLLFSTYKIYAMNPENEANVMIVPVPASVSMQQGSFTLNSSTRINLINNSKELKYSADFFSGLVENSIGGKVKTIRSQKDENNAINININSSFADEEYLLNISKERIDIEGGSPKAVFYAFQSLRQILPPSIEKGEALKVIELPCAMIKDKPDFAYRGIMLDVCRHFFTVPEIKQFIDILALHKINTFHWHLTDDQGWRIEIKKYPNLTKIGSVRAQTLKNHSHDVQKIYDGTPYSGYYTQKEIKEIVDYATKHFITVIPEIEMPGHATAALASYPYLGCKGSGYKVMEEWGISKDVYCAGKESTFKFLEDVLTEVMKLFPSEYIHVGGDECPKDAWKECPLCQKRIKDESLKDEAGLQSYFTDRIEKFLNQHGRKLIGWDEILEGGISKTATVMSWRGAKGGIKAASMGNDVIMSPNTYCYLDYYQSTDAKNEPLAIGGYLPVEKVYDFNPYEDIDSTAYKYIKGVQGNIWTEYIGTFGHLQYMSLPRMAAISETGWSYSRKNYDDFSARMRVLAKRYDYLGYNYAKHMFSPQTTKQN